MNIERILLIVGSIGSVIGGVWAIDEWLLPSISPGISLLIGNYPWIGWLALFIIIGSITFWAGRRIERRRKPSLMDSQPPPIVPFIPKGARRVETVVDYPKPGTTRTIVTVDYVDGLPTTPNPQRRNIFQQANNFYTNRNYEEAITLFRKLLVQPYSPSEEIALHIFIANCFRNLYKFKEAESHYKNALEKSEKHADLVGKAVALTNLSAVYNDRGMLDNALMLHKQAVRIQGEIGDLQGEAVNLANIGNAYLKKGELNKAIQYFKQALKIDKKIEDRKGEAQDLKYIGNLYLLKNEFNRALLHFQQALKLDSETGDREGEVNALCNIGIVYDETIELDKAREQYQKAIAIYREIGDRRGEAKSLSNVGATYLATGDLNKALQYFKQAQKIFKDTDAKQEAEIVKNLIIRLARQ